MARTLANIEQLFDVSRRLNVMSSDIASLKSNGDSLVNGTEWEGKSASDFRAFWSQFSADLAKAQGILQEGSATVNTKAGLYQEANS